MRLGLQDNGRMETPADHEKASWYEPGPTPGEQGPAVIAGHVTWNGDRSVFFDLGDLERGDRINVRREDGRTALFEVERIER
jgi:sortase (surface protein transpeptidase)